MTLKCSSSVDRRRRFEPNADPAAFVDISALGGNSPDHIFGR